MKVLGMVCSPRVRGNTEIMVQEALAGAQEEGADVELVSLSKKNIMPCDGCLSCVRKKVCHIKDDMTDIYTKLLEADGIIFGTPLYFSTESAQAKALIDRTYVFWEPSSLKDKAAAVVVTTSGGKGLVAIEAFSEFIKFQKMINVGAAVGNGGSKKGKYGMEWPRDIVKNDTKALAEAKDLGKAVVKRIQSPEISS